MEKKFHYTKSSWYTEGFTEYIENREKDAWHRKWEITCKGVVYIGCTSLYNKSREG